MLEAIARDIDQRACSVYSPVSPIKRLSVVFVQVVQYPDMDARLDELGLAPSFL